MVGNMLLVASALALSLTSQAGAARILALLPYNARSHFIVMEPLLQELAARGHNLTVVSSFPQKTPLANYHDIDLSPILPSAVNNYTLASIQEKMPDAFRTAIFITEIHLACCEKVMKDPRVLNLLNEKFDLVIGEIFGSDCFDYFAYKMKTPFISWVTSTASPWIADRVGLPDNPSYIPTYLNDYSAEMNFFERVCNSFMLLYAKAAYYYFSEIPSQKLAEQMIREKLPPMSDVTRRTSLVLVNSHFSLSQSRPFPPNVIEVGGIHIKETKPLPQDLKQILDNSKEGVVLFSLGSLVRVSSLPPRIMEMFLRALGAIPQRVIFKYEQPLPNAPPNIVVRNWLPQTDIVAHPNVKAVVVHGGLASTIESVYFGKPLVGVPFFSDQFLNIKNVVRRGGGRILDISNLSEKDISEALSAVLNDPSYSENMKRLSSQFKDRPLMPLQTGVYWTEYVIRHQGAPHLRPASVSLPLYQYLLLDVIAVLVASVAAVVFAISIIVKLLCRFVCGYKNYRSSKVVKVKRTKKNS